MPPGPHVAHPDGEGEGKDRDAVLVDALECLVIDCVPVGTVRTRGVGAEHNNKKRDCSSR